MLRGSVMPHFNRTIPVLLILLVVITITAIAAWSGQEQSPPLSKEQRRHEFESQFPIADYSTPEPADPNERAKRKTKGKKHDKSIMAVSPLFEVSTTSEHWASNLPALPVAQ